MKLSPINCNKPGSFIDMYERLLERLKPSRILEIGVQNGDSLRMWANAFPQAEVVGLDIEMHNGVFPTNVKLVSGNQKDVRLLQSLGRFDFVVDDGSHYTEDQQISFETLFPALNPGGVYVIEDLETNRQEEFQNSALTTVEYFINKLAPKEQQRQWLFSFVAEGIKSITFERDLLVIEKL